MDEKKKKENWYLINANPILTFLFSFCENPPVIERDVLVDDVSLLNSGRQVEHLKVLWSVADSKELSKMRVACKWYANSNTNSPYA